MEIKNNSNTIYKWFLFIITFICIIFIVLTIILSVALKNSKTNNPNTDFQNDKNINNKKIFNWPQPSGSLKAVFKKAAIATDNGLCSEIGRDILFEGGNSVDASIASLLCVGVVNPQSSGIGGGFIMTLFNASTGRCTTIDARETAPSLANSTIYYKLSLNSSVGYKSIATPGVIHGFWTIFNKYGSGKVNWTRLFQPSIRLARDGFPVSSGLAKVLEKFEQDILNDSNMRRLFLNEKTKHVYEEGDKMKNERLAELLSELSTSADPVELFYKGGIAQTIAGEMQDNDGFITLDDLSNYKTIIHDSPLESVLFPDYLTMCGPPPPSSFVIVQTIVNIIKQFYGKKKINLNDPLLYHRLIEAEKIAYTKRTKLGDIYFVKEAYTISLNMTKPSFSKLLSKLITNTTHSKDYYTSDFTDHVPDYGTSHVSAIDHDGNGVSITSTINQLLGARRVSPTLGIIWNDEMDDFSISNMTNKFGYVPSPSNFIEPKKRPMSSMSPIIIYNTNTEKIKMIVGGAGGSKIISSIAQTIIRTLLFNQTIKEAIDAPRIHNQFSPNVTEYENTIPSFIIDDLKKRNHKMIPVKKQASVVHGLVVLEDGFIHGNSDFRQNARTYPAGY